MLASRRDSLVSCEAICVFFFYVVTYMFHKWGNDPQMIKQHITGVSIFFFPTSIAICVNAGYGVGCGWQQKTTTPTLQSSLAGVPILDTLVYTEDPSWSRHTQVTSGDSDFTTWNSWGGLGSWLRYSKASTQPLLRAFWLWASLPGLATTQNHTVKPHRGSLKKPSAPSDLICTPCRTFYTILDQMRWGQFPLEQLAFLAAEFRQTILQLHNQEELLCAQYKTPRPVHSLLIPANIF